MHDKNRKMKSFGLSRFRISITKVLLGIITIFITMSMMTSHADSMSIRNDKDEIANLSFSHDGKKVLFDRCKSDGCQIQVYDLETGELAAYQSPENEVWTMARQSYDGKKIVFSVIPLVDGHMELSQVQIAVMDTDGKNYKKITSSPFPKIYPTFSHSGRKVLYAKAGRMRKQGRTPADDFDAWEVDLATGKETRLTYFAYMKMNSLHYYPDDESILYLAEGAFAFPGLEFRKDAEGRFLDDLKEAMKKINDESVKRKVPLFGILTLKKGDQYPRREYELFEKGHPPIRPLLSKDGKKLFFEAEAKAGKFYLYSPDGKHRLVGEGGAVNSASISPDGELLGIISADYIMQVFHVKDGALNQCVALRENKPNRDYGPMRSKIKRILTDKPKHILNQ